jgi:hypothetical protein
VTRESKGDAIAGMIRNVRNALPSFWVSPARP